MSFVDEFFGLRYQDLIVKCLLITTTMVWYNDLKITPEADIMAAAKSGFYYPNKMARIYLIAIEEMIGPEAMKALLNLAGLSQFIEAYPPNNMGREVDFAEFSAIGAALEKMYGPRGERGLGLHAGKASFNQGFAEFGSLSGFGELAFKAISPNAKLKIGLKALAEAFNKFSDQQTIVEANDNALCLYHSALPGLLGPNQPPPDLLYCHRYHPDKPALVE